MRKDPLRRVFSHLRGNFLRIPPAPQSRRNPRAPLAGNSSTSHHRLESAAFREMIPNICFRGGRFCDDCGGKWSNVEDIRGWLQHRGCAVPDGGQAVGQCFWALTRRVWMKRDGSFSPLSSAMNLPAAWCSRGARNVASTSSARRNLRGSTSRCGRLQSPPSRHVTTSASFSLEPLTRYLTSRGA